MELFTLRRLAKSVSMAPTVHDTKESSSVKLGKGKLTPENYIRYYAKKNGWPEDPLKTRTINKHPKLRILYWWYYSLNSLRRYLPILEKHKELKEILDFQEHHDDRR